MTMAQQTAVEWLVEFMQDHCIRIHEIVIDKAKEMEKEQIIEAHNHGEYFASTKESLDDENGKQYYNETYGK